ncbi:MAG TPA: hypothetical protein PKA06_10265, partial [Gemmatales bacterium]|nr:hypothetical protein [Gemmatales bacterium]
MLSIPHYELHHQRFSFDLSAWGKLVLRGQDRSAFLQNFITNDVVQPGPGSGCEAFLLTAQARIVAWLRIAVRAEDILVIVEPGLALKVKNYLERFIIAEDVEITDVSNTHFLWLVQHLPGLNSLAIWQHTTWPEADITLQRCDMLGQPAGYVFGPLDKLPSVRHAWGTYPLLSWQEPLWNTMRLEAGTPQYGNDFDEQNLPQEVNRT